MLTPVFSCSQDDKFVVVRIILSALCKVMDAAFDLNGTQFTFYASPYYLRLRFLQEIAEGRGERATYDLEANVMTVYLPKAVQKEVFEQLDNPSFLIATEKQRSQLVSVLSSSPSGGQGGDREAASDENQSGGDALGEPETEYVQTLQSCDSAAAVHGGAAEEDTEKPDPCYGLSGAYSGLFSRLDADVVHEILQLPINPDLSTPELRRRLRLEAEQSDFNEDAVLCSFDDEDGEVERLLQYVPQHVKDLQSALGRSHAKVYASAPAYTAVQHEANDAHEEEATTLLGLPGDNEPVTVWGGNVAAFERPPIIEVVSMPTAAEDGAEQGRPNLSSGLSPFPPIPPSSTPGSARQPPSLAIPTHRPTLCYTREESEVLQRLKLPRYLFPPSALAVDALTTDLLLAEAYDDLVTEGGGCSETLWNITQLSPALSYLDAPDTVYDACVAFARRVLVYPLHRHFAVVSRALAVVGARLLLGKAYTIRALLRLRCILSHAEHKHVLCTLYLDPLIGYWMNLKNAEERLVAVALEIHQHVSRTAPEPVKTRSTGVTSSLLRVSHWPLQQTAVLNPLTLLFLGLPFDAEQCEE